MTGKKPVNSVCVLKKSEDNQKPSTDNDKAAKAEAAKSSLKDIVCYNTQDQDNSDSDDDRFFHDQFEIVKLTHVPGYCQLEWCNSNELHI
jgi:hypothetical protein